MKDLRRVPDNCFAANKELASTRINRIEMGLEEQIDIRAPIVSSRMLQQLDSSLPNYSIHFTHPKLINTLRIH